jgi:hypothetical protein
MAWRVAKVTICRRVNEERVGSDHQCVDFVAAKRREGGLDFKAVARTNNLQLDADHGGRPYQIFGEGFGCRLIRIRQRTNASDSRKKLAQQAQPLGSQLAEEIVYAGNVAPRAIKTCDKSKLDRVIGHHADNGNRSSRSFSRASCIGIGCGDNDRHLSPDQISS